MRGVTRLIGWTTPQLSLEFSNRQLHSCRKLLMLLLLLLLP
jgi:hypothetical protein